MYKFRTMIVGAENLGTRLFSFQGDQRITRVGGLLRRLSLDEVPQLFNVLLGQMSLVGPRPPVVGELNPYSDLPPEFKVRFSVRPGITGLAQVSGRNELTWPEKISIDIEYVRQFRAQGIRADLPIYWKTFWAVLSRRNTVEPVRGPA
jgi:lipopolysaccharide/colanic/teichoic acid biosynthesis glycosyltransferase